MGRFYYKLVILAFLITLLLVFYHFRNDKEVNMSRNNSQTTSVSSNDTKDFQSCFSGKWLSEDKTQEARIEMVNDSVKIELFSVEKNSEVIIIESIISEHIRSDKRWILKTKNDGDQQYSLQQISKEEIVFYSSTTALNSDSTTKPVHFFRVNK